MHVLTNNAVMHLPSVKSWLKLKMILRPVISSLDKQTQCLSQCWSIASMSGRQVEVMIRYIPALIDNNEGSSVEEGGKSVGSGSEMYFWQFIVVKDKALKTLLLKAESLLSKLSSADTDEMLLSLLICWWGARNRFCWVVQHCQMKAGPAVNLKQVELE